MGRPGQRRKLLTKHFEPEDWIDYTRKLETAEKRQTMEHHLSSGCNICSASLLFWSGIAQAASREASYQPPNDVVRIAKAMGAMQQIKPSRSPFTVFAELVMDSSRLPAAAGFRSSGLAPWLLLYRAGSVNIDLRFEEVPASSRVSVVGQVVDLSKADQPIAGARVAVFSVDSEMEKTATNKFGEFHLEFEPKSQMHFTIKITDDKEIFVPLKRSMPEFPGGVLY